MEMTTLSIENEVIAACRPLSETPHSLQSTLMSSVKLTGTGLHSGGETRVIIHPAPENTGIMFRRDSSCVAGLACNVTDTSRGTTIGENGATILTVEHLMAALRGRGVDNAVIEVSGPELPALDGSARPYVEAIDSVGLAEQSVYRNAIILKEPVWVQGKDSFVLAVPAPYLQITYVLNYDHPMIGSQTATYVFKESDFGQEIAPARTFVLYEEVAGLLDRNLARGGSLDNAIVIYRDHMSSELRFPDELVRHKVMDLVGDVALVGGLLQAEILAVKSGHRLNVEFAREVSRVIAEGRSPRTVDAV